MPVTRSASRAQRVCPMQLDDANQTTADGIQEAPLQESTLPRTQSVRSKNSRKVELTRAKEELAMRIVEEARAIKELALARVARIEAEADEKDSIENSSVDGSFQMVESWLSAQLDEPQRRNQETRENGQQDSSRPVVTGCRTSPLRDDTAAMKTPGIEEESRAVLEGRSSRSGREEDRKTALFPNVQPSTIDLTVLAAAIAQAAQAGSRPSSSPKYLQELPIYNGANGEWLAFKAAYRDTETYFSATENIARLRRSLRGTAKEAVGSLLISEAEPEEIMKMLESRFGRPDAIIIAELEKLTAIPRPGDNARDICVFACKVANCVATVKALNRPQHLHNPKTVRLMVEKMSTAMKYRWYDFDAEQPEEPDLAKFSRYLNREAERCGKYAQPEMIKEEETSFKKTQRTFTIGDPIDSKRLTGTCAVCSGGHRIYDCVKFKEMSVDSRWDLAKKKQLCFKCLRYRSQRHDCKPRLCRIDGCRFTHNRLLHSARELKTSQAPMEGRETEESDRAVINSAQPKSPQAFLKVVPVSITGPKSSVDTYALLDEGSTVTLIDAAIADVIGATGPVEPFYIEAVAGARIDASRSKRVAFKIRGKYQQEEHELCARTMDRLHLSTQSVDRNVLSECTHLCDIAAQLEYEDSTPTVLIGQDNWNLIITREIKDGPRHQPVASRTNLGWVLHGLKSGRAKKDRKPTCGVNKIRVADDQRIEEMLKEYFELDSIGIQPCRPKSDPEQRALAILEQRSRRLPGGRYETGLLWREEESVIPNNYEAAVRRLEGIEKKLDKDESLKRQYKLEIEHLLQSGYAVEAVTPPQNGRTWYLPHFAVVNPSKARIRIVYDAAAKAHGVSLNDMLLTGPDLLQSLPGVLMRFRQRRVAVMADIREMFLQIRIREEDRDAQRFLWRDDRREGAPREFQMTSVIFGAASSPCTAIFIKNKNAEEHRRDFPEAADAIVRNHYMDDYLQSFDTVEEASRIASEVAYIHSCAKFVLQKWTSNEPAAIATLSSVVSAATVELKGGGVTEKILGLIWEPVNDVLAFNVDLRKVPRDIVNGEKKPTKREALKTVMSVFDPLGLATPILIQAKRILQETWRLGIGWDDELRGELYRLWGNWLERVKQLSSLRMPRCYQHYAAAQTVELHTFVDASESAYAAAVYWRLVRKDGFCSVVLAAAKGRVAPLKVTSIPRLELQAAVIGSRLAKTVEEEHDRKPSRRVFWTDSQTVLTWIRTGSRAYKPFVAHRLAEIEEFTKVGEWRWVPSRDNVADDATREPPNNFGIVHRWFQGPDFLKDKETGWPTEPTRAVVEETGEERVTIVMTCNALTMLPDVARFSSWLRLIRATARVIQFIELCRNRLPVDVVTRRNRRCEGQDSIGKASVTKKKLEQTGKRTEKPRYVSLEGRHMKLAETMLVKAVQRDTFAEEIAAVKCGKPVLKSSRLAQLALSTGDDNTLRLKSRIAAIDGIHNEQKEPAVLDGDHPYTRLYMDWVHRQLQHGGVEVIVNEVRQRFWVLRIRNAARSIVKKCLPCRIRRATPASPPTGDHPPSRLAHHRRAFTYVGIDYFGPVSVTVGRQHRKRYIALFTCLTTRAIHLEIATSLSTDSAILALRRMIARRGCPTEIWSDNGTNFRGADAELKRSALEAAKDEASVRAIEWKYIPPGAPFMGGVWERLIRSVKVALQTTLRERHPSEEVLATLLVEVEHTVNSRPLTHISTSPEDPEALTPNHFLLGGPSRVPLPGTFTEADTAGRKQWRQSQRLADYFWSRWVREYLPVLQYRREPHGRGKPPEIDDLVLIVDENLPRNVWPRGRVISTYPGKDGVIRVLDVETKAGVLRRPTKKVVVLPK